MKRFCVQNRIAKAARGVDMELDQEHIVITAKSAFSLAAYVHTLTRKVCTTTWGSPCKYENPHFSIQGQLHLTVLLWRMLSEKFEATEARLLHSKVRYLSDTSGKHEYKNSSLSEETERLT